MHEAKYYTALPGNTVRCELCPFACTIRDGSCGNCAVRCNTGGRLYSAIYGKAVSVSLDPIEKKPLYHFYPGSGILSLGTFGCNLHCVFCQNHEISQPPPEYQVYLKDITVDDILSRTRDMHAVGIAYTYNEPLVWYEFVYDTARAVQSRDLKNVLVTNGVINPAPLKALLPYIDAVNIDLKAIKDSTYTKQFKVSVDVVKNTIETCMRAGVHVEITHLMVTGINDNEEDINELIVYVAGLNRKIPLHFSRYHPRYRYTARATDTDLLARVYRSARKKLDNVYVGNIIDATMANSYCPACGCTLVDRAGYTVTTHISENTCPNCGAPLNFIV